MGLDSNVLAYLAGVDRAPADDTQIEAIGRMLARAKANAQFLVPVQALGELFVVLTRARATREEAGAIVSGFAEAFETIGADDEALSAAIDLAVQHRLQFWDSLICATAARAGCSLLLSEDMQDGFAWRGLTLVNPFAAHPHARLQALTETR